MIPWFLNLAGNLKMFQTFWPCSTQWLQLSDGHCFVSLMLCVPIWSNRRIAYLRSLSVTACGRKKNRNWSLPQHGASGHALFCFSEECHNPLWQLVRQEKISPCIVDEYPNLDLICNARADSVIYDLAHSQPAEEAGPQSMGNAFLLKRTSLFLLKR